MPCRHWLQGRSHKPVLAHYLPLPITTLSRSLIQTTANQFNWFVDGTDQFAQEAFWFRVGNVPEQSVHTLPIAVQGTTDGNFDGNADTLFVRHTGAGFRIDLKYSLAGGTVKAVLQICPSKSQS